MVLVSSGAIDAAYFVSNYSLTNVVDMKQGPTC